MSTNTTGNSTNAPEVTLESVVVFSLDAISLWSGRRRLKREDLRDADDLPPQDLASLGSKKIIDPEEISDFEALKKEAHRECAKVGVRFLGGYAVPSVEAPALAVLLDDVAARFDQRKATFIAAYDKATTDWVKDHPDWSEMLQEAVLTRADVEGRLRFGYSAFRVVTASDDGDDALSSGLNAEVGGLASQLYTEVAQAAATVMEKSLLGRDRVTQKILSPIRSIRKKLFGLSFLDKRVQPLIDTIDHILDKLPPAGHIEGIELSALHGLVFIMSSTDRMRQHGDLIVSGKTVEEAAEESIPALAVQEEPEEVVQESPANAQPDLFVQTTQPIQPTVTAEPPIQAAPATGFGAGMASATYGVRKIMAPPPVQRRI